MPTVLNVLSRWAILFVVLMMGISSFAHAEDRLARVFQDNMVLQREKPVPIWGWASPGTQVEVDFAGQKKQAKADDKGYWKAVLDPMKANSKGQDLTAKIGSTTLTCKDVLVGEVWLTAGHSGTIAVGPNVDTGFYPHYPFLPGASDGKPEIRFFTVNFGASLEPYADLDPVVQGGSHWQAMQEGPVTGNENFARSDEQYFAQYLRDKLNVPVGILNLVCVGVMQQSWMSKETLESLPDEKGTSNCYQELLALDEAGFAKSTGPVKSWADFKKLEDAWRVSKNSAWPPGGNVVGIYNYPTVGYNTRIYPLAPYALRGVRGFANPALDTGGAEGIVAWVKQWRELFGQDFYFINCSSIRTRTTSQPPLMPAIEIDKYNDEIYRSMKLFGDDQREDYIECRDLCSWLAHHLQRAEEGRRLATTALSLAYGQPQTADGFCPRMAETKIEGNKAIVRFDRVGDGIVYQPSIDGISGVYLRDKSGPGRWAQVKVLGKDTVEFSSPDITDLVTVAYGQNSNPHETLFSSGGMPASGFVVNPPQAGGKPDSQPPYRMVSMVGETGFDHVLNNDVVKNAHISLAHVRRGGYVFQIIGKEAIDNAMQPIKQTAPDLAQSSAATSVVAYIPAEWKGYEVMKGDKCDIPWVNGGPVSKGMIKTGGELLKTTETTKDGARFVTFDAPVDGTWVIVAEKGKAKDFLKINRY